MSGICIPGRSTASTAIGGSGSTGKSAARNLRVTVLAFDDNREPPVANCPYECPVLARSVLHLCPPAPLMLKAATKKGGGNAAFLASLHLSLAALAFLTVPAVLTLLSMALGFRAEVDLGVMIWILAKTILLPVGLGLAVRALFPAAADRFAAGLGKAGTAGLGLVVLFALTALYPALLNMDTWSYLVIVLVSAAALAIGHWFGADEPEEKTIVAVECGVRHPVLALTIGIANFSRQEALPILVPCILTFIVMATRPSPITPRWCRRSRPAGCRRWQASERRTRAVIAAHDIL